MENNSPILKVKVIELPKSKDLSKWIAIIITFLFSLSGIIWSIFTYNKLLPLQEARVIFSDSDIRIVCFQPTGNVQKCGLENQIKNVGNSIAKDVSFKIYAISFDDPTGVELVSDTIFNDKLSNDLFPSSSAKFGTNTLEGNIGRKAMLINHLHYFDDWTKKYYDKVFWFQYTIGDSAVFSAIEKERNKISDDRFKELFTNENDEYLLDQLNQGKI